MRFRLAALLLAGMTALAALGASLAAMESLAPVATGSIHGYVLTLVGPTVGYKKATFTAVVEIVSAGHVLARNRVSPGAQFRFTEPVGTDAVAVAGHNTCSGTVRFLAHTDRATTVRCSPFEGAGPAPG